MMQSFPGSRWWKFDFHTHSPRGSEDYKGDKNLIPMDWLKAYQAAGLDCVVITDHNSGSWVDDVKSALTQLRTEDEAWKAFYIFPGVEISCSGGVHLLAILDVDKTSQDIAALVGACGYGGRLGDSNAVTTKGFEDVIEVVHTQFNGIAIAAHIDCPKGLLKAVADDITRSQFLHKVDAVQLVNLNNISQLVSGEETLKKINTLAQLQASDNHDAQTLKTNCFTWVKLTNPDLQGLKLALAEPDISIFRSDKTLNYPQALPKHWIQRLSIQNLEKRRQLLEIDFNPWLNTVIGGRGSGKSSIVECLRLALGRGGEAEKTLGEKHETSKAIERFKTNMVRETPPTTALKATVSGAGDLGGVYRYDWSPNSLTVLRPDANNFEQWIATDINGQAVPREFPVRIFSQKQIHALATKPDGLLAYFDEAANAHDKTTQAELRASITELTSTFRRHRSQIRQLREELKDWPQIKDQLKQIEQSLATYARQGVSDKLLALQVLRAETRALTDFQTGLECEVKQVTANLPELKLTEWQIQLPANASPAAVLLANKWHLERDALNEQWLAISKQMALLQERASAMKAVPEYKDWEAYARPQEESYRQALEQVKTQLGGQLQQVGVLQQQKEQLEQKDKLYTAKNQRLQVERADAASAYDALVKAHKNITVGRQAFVNLVIGDERQPLLKITFQSSAQYGNAEKEALRGLLKLNSAEYANSFLGDPSDHDSTGVLRTLKTSPEKLDQLKKELNKLPNSAEVLPEQILGASTSGSYIRSALKSLTDEQLDSVWTWFPKDKVEIQFRVSSQEEWQDIANGSAGQQTGALLSFILNEGDEPLILDQPEDDLDNAMVYELVVQQLRKNKERRQVIVVTHNANIVVNGDAELVISMAFKGGQIQMDTANGLQDMSIRRTICKVMEGGRIAFDKRYKRILKGMT
jgi:hypothetical protein